MRKLLEWLDDLAGIGKENKLGMWLERISFIFLILLVIFAPHSIAASQISWLCGMAAWGARFLIKPRPKIFKTPLNLALWAFFGWSVLSAFLSYAPEISIDKLRSVSLFTAFLFVANNLRTKRAAIFLAFMMIASCMVSVLWMPVERIIGRGVEVAGVSKDSPLTKGVLAENNSLSEGVIKDGDTIVKVNNKKIYSPETLLDQMEANETIIVNVYRPDYYVDIKINRADLLPGTTVNEKLGIQNWAHGRNWRSSGFYSQYVTYAEMLQLVTSLNFGLLIMLFREKNPTANQQKLKIVLSVCVAAMLLALLLTITRASQVAFVVSAFVIMLIGTSRKTFLTLTVSIIPLALLGVFVLQQSRNVGFYDLTDKSITWRQTVYREGAELATSSPRHLLIGVGMDSIKKYAGEWGLFDHGKLPIGHFHSTPLQIAIERGMPALFLWFLILWLYARILWRDIKTENVISKENGWQQKGIVLGAFGGMIGFFTSGLVHYNLGDGEVAMVFYILMAISVFLAKSNEPAKEIEE